MSTYLNFTYQSHAWVVLKEAEYSLDIKFPTLYSNILISSDLVHTEANVDISSKGSE